MKKIFYQTSIIWFFVNVVAVGLICLALNYFDVKSMNREIFAPIATVAIFAYFFLMDPLWNKIESFSKKMNKASLFNVYVLKKYIKTENEKYLVQYAKNREETRDFDQTIAIREDVSKLNEKQKASLKSLLDWNRKEIVDGVFIVFVTSRMRKELSK